MRQWEAALKLLRVCASLIIVHVHFGSGRLVGNSEVEFRR